MGCVFAQLNLGWRITGWVLSHEAGQLLWREDDCFYGASVCPRVLRTATDGWIHHRAASRFFIPAAQKEISENA